jgi:hypothetical protein
MARGNPNSVGAPDANQSNLIARNAVLSQSVNMIQSIFQQTYNTNIPNTVINVPIRNVGLLKRLLVKITATVQRSAAETQNRTALGPANILSQVVFTDLSNQTRINTTGWHLHYLATARRQMAYGAAFANDTPTNIGSNYNVISAPAAFTAGAQTISMYYEIPLAYGDFDLRGAIFMSIVNATANLQLTINPSFFVGSGADGTLAVYKSSTANDLGTITALTVTVYQNYLDQLPYVKGGPVLPLIDLSTAYLLNNTVATGAAQNQDLAVPYANFRNFMSTFAMWDNNAALAAGTDINYWLLQAANYTNIWKFDPITASLFARNIINDDFPAGIYYFDHRTKPISTIQYGNMQLVMNPSSAIVNGQLFVGYESLAIIDQITQAGSLYNT